MSESGWRPSLPEWVPFPRVAWFVVEGTVIGLAGLLLRESLPSVQAAVTFGNVAFFVGATTAMLGIVAYVILVVINR